MTTYKRSGNKWTISELISLQREYELLEWTIQQIADKHERSVEAVLYCLEREEFISSWNKARGYNMHYDYQKSFDDNICQEEEEEEEEDSSLCQDPNDIQILTERVLTLENIIFDVKDIMQQMVMNEKKKDDKIYI